MHIERSYMPFSSAATELMVVLITQLRLLGGHAVHVHQANEAAGMRAPSGVRTWAKRVGCVGAKRVQLFQVQLATTRLWDLLSASFGSGAAVVPWKHSSIRAVITFVWTVSAQR
jgi:hypothetical protein